MDQLRCLARCSTTIFLPRPLSIRYFIISGEVEVICGKDADAQRLGFLGKGSFFGESALLTEEPRNAFVRASKTLQLYVLSKESLSEVFTEFPDVERIVKEPLEERKIARIKAEEEAVAARNHKFPARLGNAQQSGRHGREKDACDLPQFALWTAFAADIRRNLSRAV